MKLPRLINISVLIVICSLVSACSGVGNDYLLFRESRPASVLVLPPVNYTAEIRATDVYLSTVSQPLAEAGYYVFPVALVDTMLKENGVPTPSDMRQVSLVKLKEVFGADAVMYITIEEWGTKYLVLGSTTSVKIQYELVDLSTGATIWQREQYAVDNSSSNSGGGLVGMIAAATVHALVNTATDSERKLAIQANNAAFHNGYRLLKGPRHPKHVEDMSTSED